MRIALVVGALLVSSSALAQEAKPAPAPTFSKDECAVWARELGFADSVAQHDAKAFTDFVHPGAVFSANTPRPTRGRAAILEEWTGIIDGSALGLSWYPDVVVIGGEPGVALSSGPALLESRDPKAAHRHSLAAPGACCSTAVPRRAPPATPTSRPSAPGARPVRRAEG